MFLGFVLVLLTAAFVYLLWAESTDPTGSMISEETQETAETTDTEAGDTGTTDITEESSESESSDVIDEPMSDSETVTINEIEVVDIPVLGQRCVDSPEVDCAALKAAAAQVIVR